MACGGPNTFKPPPPGDHGTHGSELADDDEYKPPTARPRLDRALITERGLEAAAERIMGELEAAGNIEKLEAARGDLAVRRRFIATLEACAASKRKCPPRRADPPFALVIDGRATPPPARHSAALRSRGLAEGHRWSCTVARVRAARWRASMVSKVAIAQLETQPADPRCRATTSRPSPVRHAHASACFASGARRARAASRHVERRSSTSSCCHAVRADARCAHGSGLYLMSPEPAQHRLGARCQPVREVRRCIRRDADAARAPPARAV